MKFQKREYSCKYVWFVALVFVFAINGFGQYNTFDGKSVELIAPDAGNRCVAGFGGNPTVKRLPGNTASVTIKDCAGNTLGTITDTSGYTVTRDSTTGYWCFQTTDTKVTVTYTATATKTWTWLANTSTTGFYNVKDFGALGDAYSGKTDVTNGNRNPTANDTTAIQNALIYAAAKQGGTVYFPEGVYAVDSTLVLPPGVIIKGTSGMSSSVTNNYYVGNYSKTNSTIVLRGTNKPLFRIGECVYGVKMANINLKAESTTGTYGVEAVGIYRAGSDSQNITFENVAFTEFSKGLYFHGYNTDVLWHVDYVNVDHCVFTYNKTAGIEIGTYDTDWKISSSVFHLTGAGQSGTDPRSDGIVINQGGGILIEQSFGGGIDYSNALRGGTFIKVIAVGGLTILNSSSERASESINYGTNYGTYGNVLTIINSGFGDPVNINGRVNLVSTGNQYAGKTVNTVSGVRIYSTGDRFCQDLAHAYDLDAPCGRDSNNNIIPLNEAGFQGSGTIVFQTGQPREQRLSGGTVVKELAAITNKMKGDLEIKGDDREATSGALANTRPILSVTVDNDGLTPIKPLIRMGQSPFVYDITRDTRGWLKFSGSQDHPFRGFFFSDAPFQLPSFTLTQITSSDFGQAQAGTTVYCSNCNVNTSPCTSGGSGALAVLNGSSVWSCK